jgi:hypothetical protein
MLSKQQGNFCTYFSYCLVTLPARKGKRCTYHGWSSEERISWRRNSAKLTIHFLPPIKSKVAVHRIFIITYQLKTVDRNLWWALTGTFSAPNHHSMKAYGRCTLLTPDAGHRGRADSNTRMPSLSEGLGLQYRPRNQPSWLGFFVVFLSPFRLVTGQQNNTST